MNIFYFFGVLDSISPPKLCRTIEKFTNILKDSVAHELFPVDENNNPLNFVNRRRRCTLENTIPICSNYDSRPILSVHHKLLELFTIVKKPNIIRVITNRHALRALATNKNQKFKMFSKVLNVNGEKLKFIVIQLIDETLHDEKYKKNYETGFNLEQELLKDITKYLTFSATVKELKLPSCTLEIYYTSQIDGFHNGKSIEIKAHKCKASKCISFPSDVQIKYVLQCILGGVDDIIVGFHEKNKKKLLLQAF